MYVREREIPRAVPLIMFSSFFRGSAEIEAHTECVNDCDHRIDRPYATRIAI
jgi:hypothetical protein